LQRQSNQENEFKVAKITTPEVINIKKQLDVGNAVIAELKLNQDDSMREIYEMKMQFKSK
jgi:SepF-like predicted cell division protein (DUF552 family)